MKINFPLTLPLAAVFLCAPVFADEVIQKRELAAVLRQLDLAERLAQGSERTQSATPEARYHFDYPRFYDDLARIRAGIFDYLNPPRAQPRDVSPLPGEYRREVEIPRQPGATDREVFP
jgi:RAQPRD family integrative conjugative element protein